MNSLKPENPSPPSSIYDGEAMIDDDDATDSLVIVAVQEIHHHRVKYSYTEQSPLLLQKNASNTTAISLQQPENIAVHSNNRKKEAMGMLLVLLGAVTFSLMGVLIKLCGAKFSSFEILLVRSAIQSVAGTFCCICLGVNPVGPRGTVRYWIAFRGIVGGLSVAAGYYALTHLPFSDATAILYLNAPFTTFLAAVFLSEPFHLYEGTCLSLCFIGSILVSKPEFLFNLINNDQDIIGRDVILHYNMAQFGNDRGFAIFTAISGAFMIAVTFFIVRKVGEAVHFLVHTVYYGVLSTLICIPPLLLTVQPFVWPQNLYETTILLTSGVLAFIGQCFFNKGLQMCPAGKASLMNMNGLVLSFLNGMFIFDEYPDVFNISGSLLIGGTTAMLALRKK